MMKKQFKEIRLILADQLDIQHSWFSEPSTDILYVLVELKQEVEYCHHHHQKIVAFFLAMENFANTLKQSGHHCLHLNLDKSTPISNNLPDLLEAIAKQFQASFVRYQQPDEYRLEQQLLQWQKKSVLNIDCDSSEHFYLKRSELPTYFKANKSIRLENFYRKMRIRFNVLMEPDDARQPLSGTWNFDSKNRQALKAKDLNDIPAPLIFNHPVKIINQRIAKHQIKTIGEVSDHNRWPSTRDESLSLLHYFCQYLLPNFGRFQDAMTQASEHAWSLYHSRLSFALNSKMLKSHEVIDHAMMAFNADTSIDIAQVEGFIRQILGWREYIRGMYWVNMPNYKDVNALSATRDLPQWFWHGNTKMQCMQKTINQSLKYAYAHHIQRLMITGNFSLLAGLAPHQVDAWYLGIYIDAIEWVELPNTRGMALFADGGLIASKPYTASANYINKMSDYCKSCHYKFKQRTGERACPFNSLYWHFLYKHQTTFSSNPRLAFAYKNLTAMPKEDLQALNHQAECYLKNIESL